MRSSPNFYLTYFDVCLLMSVSPSFHFWFVITLQYPELVQAMKH